MCTGGCASKQACTHALQVKTSRTFLRDCTVVSPMALLLFGGALSVMHEGGYVLVDDWLRIRASAPTAVLVKKLHGALDALLADKVRNSHESIIKDRMHAHAAVQVW